MVPSRRHGHPPRHFSVFQLAGGSEFGCGGDSGGGVVPGVDVGDHGVH